MSGHRIRRALAGSLACAACLSTSIAHAQPRAAKPPHKAPEGPATSIPVVVLELAGKQAYVKPGASGGVHRGAKVVINRKEYPVVETTSSYAVIDVGAEVVHEQDHGESTIVDEEEEKARELPKPHPLATWEGTWPAFVGAATTQTPRYVPLGGAERDRRYDVRLMVGGGAIVPLERGTPIGRAVINARVHAEPLRSAPLTLDLDASLQNWFNMDGREGAPARPLVSARELLLGYGRDGGFYAGLGRMRYAASTLGTLDGLRLKTPLGSGFNVGAFGGVLPSPLSGAPAVDAQRFGVEATYSRPDVTLRPDAALVVHGSTFDGKLDERRISGVVGIYPGLSRFGGHFEVSSFPSDNPWGASSVELTAAGADGSIHAGIFRFGGRFDLRQPIRSRWLASYLPLSWFCRTVPAPAATPGPDLCDGRANTRALGAADVGVEVGNVALTVGGTFVGDLTHSGAAPDMFGGFASGRVVRIAKVARVEASGGYSEATYLRMISASAGPGLTLFADVLDVSAYYRFAELRYRAIDTSLLQHGVGGMAMLFPNAVLLFTAQGEAIVGDDTKAILVYGTMMWRPRF